MGLLDLLKDPSAYNVGGGSKGLDYPETKYGLSQGPLLGKRVSFDITNDLADPEFLVGDNYGRPTIDQFIRGGTKYAAEAREIDFDRIKKFLYETPNGELFLQKQITLQSLNPRPQKIYNYGVNTLASVAAAGVSNVRRGGLLPEVGGFDIGSIFGLEAGTYLSEPDFQSDNITPNNPTGTFHREKNYGLGDPGAPSPEKGIQALIGKINPFGKFGNKIGYNVSLGQEDQVNLLGIFKNSNAIPNKYEQQSADFVPFRFEVINHEISVDNDIIVFRAFLDSISDDYSATHNTFKYNGRGEEFYTYNKFNRKIQIGFKIAAQTRREMKPIYQKLNYLVAQTAPNYSSTGRIRTPYCKLTVGNWFNKIPGLITQVGLQWQKDYPWEIALDRTSKDGKLEGKDKDMLILPHVLDVNLSFQPIHKFTPSNDIFSPFIGIDGDEAGDNDWREPAKTTAEEIIENKEGTNTNQGTQMTEEQMRAQESRLDNK